MWIKYLLLMFAIMEVERVCAAQCQTFAKKMDERVRGFIENVGTCRNLRESFDHDEGDIYGDCTCPSVVGDKVFELCLAYKAKFAHPKFKVTIQGCITRTGPMRFTFSSIVPETPYTCNEKEISFILQQLNRNVKCSDNELITGWVSYWKPWCPACFISSVSPSTTPVLSSSISSTFDENTDEQRENCTEGQGQSVTSVVAIAVASFIAGVIVVLLCLWCLHLKRTAKLCFRESEKPRERPRLDRTTQQVLTEHLRDDAPTTNDTGHFVNESNRRDMENDIEGVYSFIDEPETGRKPFTGSHASAPTIHQHPGTGIQTKDTDRQQDADILYTDSISQTCTDEHVYTHIESESRVEHMEQPRGMEDGVGNKKQAVEADKGVERLHDADITKPDVFDRDRLSTTCISGHDYFVLKKENLRASHQADVKNSDSAHPSTSDATVILDNTENAYFILEKE